MTKRRDDDAVKPLGAHPHGDYGCSAHNCPMRATIFDSVIGPATNGRCRYHDRAAPRDWPRLTEVLRTVPFERQRMEPALAMLELPWLEPEPILTPLDENGVRLTAGAARAKINLLMATFGGLPDDPLEWARKLQAREASGELLLECQRRAWREVLSGTAPSEAELEAQAEREAIMTEGA